MRHALLIRASLLVAAALLPTTLHAQFIHVDPAVGMAYPTGRFSEYADAAPSYGIAVGVDLLPQLTVYGRYDVTSFGWGRGSDPDGEANDQGFALGAYTSFGSIMSPRFPLAPWAGIGLLFHQMEIDEIEEAEEIDEGLGLELQAGVELAPSPAMRIRPGVAYRQYRIDTGYWGRPIQGGYLPFAVEYVTPKLEVSVVF